MVIGIRNRLVKFVFDIINVWPLNYTIPCRKRLTRSHNTFARHTRVVDPATLLNTQGHHHHPRSLFAFRIEWFCLFLILLSPRTRYLWNCVINGWHIETYTRRRLCWTPSHFRMSTPRDTTIILSQYLPSESNAVICFWFYSHPGHDIYEIVS